jgi:tetratricopeptide (TPR) repeat protein
MLGRTLWKLSDKDGAEAEFLKAIDLKPNFGQAGRELGLIYSNGERWEKAIPYLQVAINQRYGDWQADRCAIIKTAEDERTGPEYLMALSLYKLGRAADADTLLSRYRLPMSVLSLELLLDTRRQLQKTDQLPDIYLEIGRFESYRKDVQGAADAFESAISYDQKRAVSYNYLAGAQIALNNFADAEKNLDKALGLNPDYYGALVRKSHLYLRQGKDAEAERLLLRAKVLDPTKVAAQYLLGVVLLRRGNVKDATREWEAASGIGYSDGRWSDYYSELEMGFDYAELMGEISLQLAVVYKQQQDYSAAARRLSTLFSGIAGNPRSTSSDEYVKLAESVATGTFDANRIPTDLLK